jgi:hypothetical protein
MQACTRRGMHAGRAYKLRLQEETHSGFGAMRQLAMGVFFLANFLSTAQKLQMALPPVKALQQGCSGLTAQLSWSV